MKDPGCEHVAVLVCPVLPLSVSFSFLDFRSHCCVTPSPADTQSYLLHFLSLLSLRAIYARSSLQTKTPFQFILLLSAYPLPRVCLPYGRPLKPFVFVRYISLRLPILAKKIKCHCGCRSLGLPLVCEDNLNRLGAFLFPPWTTVMPITHPTCERSIRGVMAAPYQSDICTFR